MLDCTEGDAQVGRLAYQTDGFVIDVDESYARRTKKAGCYLVADDVYQQVYALHTAKQTCVFDDMVVGSVVVNKMLMCVLFSHSGCKDTLFI